MCLTCSWWNESGTRGMSGIVGVSGMVGMSGMLT